MLHYVIYPSIDSSVHISGLPKRISKTFWSEGKKSQHMPLKDNFWVLVFFWALKKEQYIKSVIQRYKSKEIENEKYKKITCIQVFKE